MNTRIEVTEDGDFFIRIPYDIIDEWFLEEGEQVIWQLIEEGLIELHFAEK